MSTTRLYDNIKLFSPDNVLMCYVNQKTADFYIKSGAGISLGEKKIKLTFKPKGLGQHGTPWLIEMQNQCVTCGKKEDLTKHHVIPTCFRRHIPNKYKDSRYYELVQMCLGCHEKYETEAWKLTRKLIDTVDGSARLTNYSRAKRWIGNLLHHGDKIPEEKVIQMKQFIFDITGSEELNLDNLINPNPYKDYIDTISDYEEFNSMWKKHFYDTMNPQYLPEFLKEAYQFGYVQII